MFEPEGNAEVKAALSRFVVAAKAEAEAAGAYDGNIRGLELLRLMVDAGPLVDRVTGERRRWWTG